MPYQVQAALCCQSKRCIDECPMEAIVFNDDSNSSYIDASQCTDCGSCADICPQGAISGITEE